MSVGEVPDEARQGHRITVQGIRASYSTEKAAEDKKQVWSYYVVRRASFYPTILFLKLGISANQATWFSIVIVILGCLLLAVGEYVGRIGGALLVNIWLILDYIDGNIARYQKSSSAYGDFIDTLGGYIAYGLLFFSAGVGGYYHQESLLISRASSVLSRVDASVVLILGAWSSLTAIWIRLVYQKFNNSFPDMKMQRHEVLRTRSGFSPFWVVLEIGNNLFNLSGLLLPALLLAVVIKALDVFLLICAVANTAILIFSLARLLSRVAGYATIIHTE